MIGAEAKIAEAYHALKSGKVDRAIELLEDIAHPRARALIEQARKTEQGRTRPNDCQAGG